MPKTATMTYPCPRCGAESAILPYRCQAEGIVQCARCGLEHGSLGDIRRAFSLQALEKAIQKARQIYQVRPQRNRAGSDE